MPIGSKNLRGLGRAPRLSPSIGRRVGWPGVARLLLALFVAVPATGAHAQDVPQGLTPLSVDLDNNGVNLVTGKGTLPMPTLSVPGAPNLKFDRVQNVIARVKGKHIGGGIESTYSSASFTIDTGTGSSDSFQCNDFDCTSVKESGSRFTYGLGPNSMTSHYVQAGTGARWAFTLKAVDVEQSSTYSSSRDVVYYASSITFPNGETISYYYDTVVEGAFNQTSYRPQTISSNLGYFISITYQSDTGGTMGWQQVKEAAIYSSAAPTVPLGKLAYNVAAGTITDYGDRPDLPGRVFTCQGCSNNLTTKTEVGSGMSQLPGEAAQAMQVTAVGPTTPVVASVVRDGVQWTYAYENLEYVQALERYRFTKLTVNGPNGFRNIYSLSDNAGRKVNNITDSIDRQMLYEIDASSRPWRIVSPEGNEISISYDEYGNLTWRRTRPKTGITGEIVETAAINPANCSANIVLCYRLEWVKDGLQRQTDFLYNAAGQLIEQTDPADSNGVRRKTYIEYETGGLRRKKVVRICGGALACGTTSEMRTEYDYWGSTRLPSVERKIDAAQGVTLTTTYGYDSAGRQVSADGPLPGTGDASYFRYDQYGRKTWEIGPLGANNVRNAKKFTYRDSDNKLMFAETGTLPDAASITLSNITRVDVAYDSRRNPVREAMSRSGTTFAVLDRSYYDSGNVECETRRMNSAIFGALPASACTLGTSGTGTNDFGPDRVTRNTYDAAGQLVKVQKAYGITTANGFPATLQQDYATYEYTPNGKQKAVIDANGNRAELTFDGYDRQRRWIFPSATTAGVANQADYEEYGYDPVGNRTSLRKRDGVTMNYLYDARNRMTQKNVPASVTGAPGYVVAYAYDVNGLQTEARFGNLAGPGVSNRYDGFGRRSSISTNMDGTSRSFFYKYDAASNLIEAKNDAGQFSTYTYDAIGRLTAIKEAGITTSVRLGYDAAGRRASLGHGLGAVTSSVGYDYDPVGRLATLSRDLAGADVDQVLTFAYNPASQIVTRASSENSYASNSAYDVSRPYAINGLNQYVSAGPATFAYDANGNLASDGSTSFVYDAENRLVSASGAKTASLAYDPLGRLWQTGGGSAGITRFEYDGDRLVNEYDSVGTKLRSYVHGPGVDEPLIWYEFAGGLSRRFLHADHQGSIVAMADQNGNVIAINAYDAWGIPNAANLGRFGFTGQAWIGELGMYYYKARIYSPTLGRFMQVDPIGYDDQINLYAYAGNDPMNNTDPTGLDSCPDGSADICVTSPPPPPPPPPPLPPNGAARLGVINQPGNRDRGPYNEGWAGDCATSASACLRPAARGLLAELSCLLAVCSSSQQEVFRVVDDDELASILLTKTYTLPPNGTEGKMFYHNMATAVRNGSMFAVHWNVTYTLTSTHFTMGQLGSHIHIAGEGIAYFVHARYFPHGPVKVHDIRFLPHIVR